jgi:hypothetical protein
MTPRFFILLNAVKQRGGAVNRVLPALLQSQQKTRPTRGGRVWQVPGGEETRYLAGDRETAGGRK